VAVGVSTSAGHGALVVERPRFIAVVVVEDGEGCRVGDVDLEGGGFDGAVVVIPFDVAPPGHSPHSVQAEAVKEWKTLRVAGQTRAMSTSTMDGNAQESHQRVRRSRRWASMWRTVVAIGCHLLRGGASGGDTRFAGGLLAGGPLGRTAHHLTDAYISTTG
jgi:hypothetical protein